MKELQHFVVTVLLVTTISRHCASTDFYCQPGGSGTDTLNIQAVCNPSANSAQVSWSIRPWLTEIIIKYSCNGSQYNAVLGVNYNSSPMEINDLVPGTLCSFMICYSASVGGAVGRIQDPNQASCTAGGVIQGPTKATSIVSASKSVIKSTTLMSSSDLDVLSTVFSSSQLFTSSQLLSSQLLSSQLLSSQLLSSQLLSSQLPATAASINTTTTTATPPITYSNLYGQFSIVSSKTQLISTSPSSTSMDTGELSEFQTIIIIIVTLFLVVLLVVAVPIALSAFAFKKTRRQAPTNENGSDLPEIISFGEEIIKKKTWDEIMTMGSIHTLVQAPEYINDDYLCQSSHNVKCLDTEKQSADSSSTGSQTVSFSDDLVEGRSEETITAGGLGQNAVSQDTLAMKPPFDEIVKDDGYIMTSSASYIYDCDIHQGQYHISS